MSLINFLRDINVELNALKYVLITLVLATVIILVVWKLVLALKAQRKIDEHLRETRVRISRALTELEESKNNISKVEAEVVVPCIPEVSEVDLKGKKTRAMPMEERWAEFDKKRSMRNTA